MTEIRTTDLALPHGIVLPIAGRDDPDGVPLLLLHGSTDSWRSFEPILDLRPELPRIGVPALLVWGAQDGFVSRADQDELHRGFRDARLLANEGSGHCVQWEEPARFARDIAAFVDALGHHRLAA